MSDARCKTCKAPIGAKQAALTGNLCPACARSQRPAIFPTAAAHITRPPEMQTPSSEHHVHKTPSALQTPTPGIQTPTSEHRTPPPEREALSEQLNIRVPPSTLDALHRIAEEAGEPLPALARQILADYLDAHTTHD